MICQFLLLDYCLPRLAWPHYLESSLPVILDCFGGTNNCCMDLLTYCHAASFWDRKHLHDAGQCCRCPVPHTLHRGQYPPPQSLQPVGDGHRHLIALVCGATRSKRRDHPRDPRRLPARPSALCKASRSLAPPRDTPATAWQPGHWPRGRAG